MPPKMAAAWRQGEYEEGETPLVVSEKRTATSNSRTVPSSPWRRPDQTFRGKKRGMRPYSDTLFDRYTLRAIWRGNADSFRKGLHADLLGRTPGNLGGTLGWKIKVITRTCLKELAQAVTDPGPRKEGGPGPRGAVQWRVRPGLTLELVALRPGRSAAFRSWSRGLSLLPPWALVRPPSEKVLERKGGGKHTASPCPRLRAWAPCGLCTLCE